MANIITRDEACVALRAIIESDILNDDLENALEDILNCIESEKNGYHCWGGDTDFFELFIAHRSDLFTDELKAKLQSIHEKYSFVPAPYEKDELESFDDDEDEDE